MSAACSPGLAQSLLVLGSALAAPMDQHVREDLADALAKLAMRGGTEQARRMVLRLLDEAGEARAKITDAKPGLRLVARPSAGGGGAR